jgi:hypothetical protein
LSRRSFRRAQLGAHSSDCLIRVTMSRTLLPKFCTGKVDFSLQLTNSKGARGHKLRSCAQMHRFWADDK